MGILLSEKIQDLDEKAKEHMFQVMNYVERRRGLVEQVVTHKIAVESALAFEKLTKIPMTASVYEILFDEYEDEFYKRYETI